MQPVVNIVIYDQSHIAGIQGKNNSKGLQVEKIVDGCSLFMADEIGEHFRIALKQVAASGVPAINARQTIDFVVEQLSVQTRIHEFETPGRSIFLSWCSYNSQY